MREPPSAPVVLATRPYDAGDDGAVEPDAKVGAVPDLFRVPRQNTLSKVSIPHTEPTRS